MLPQEVERLPPLPFQDKGDAAASGIAQKLGTLPAPVLFRDPFQARPYEDRDFLEI